MVACEVLDLVTYGHVYRRDMYHVTCGMCTCVVYGIFLRHSQHIAPACTSPPPTSPPPTSTLLTDCPH